MTTEIKRVFKCPSTFTNLTVQGQNRNICMVCTGLKIVKEKAISQIYVTFYKINDANAYCTHSFIITLNSQANKISQCRTPCWLQILF